jgi:hypothetical protein
MHVQSIPSARSVSTKTLALSVITAAVVGAVVAGGLVTLASPKPPVAAGQTDPAVAAAVSKMTMVQHKAFKLSVALDDLAETPTATSAKATANTATRELRAQAEAESSPKAQAALELLPRVDAAIASGDSLEMNRLAVQMQKIVTFSRS